MNALPSIAHQFQSHAVRTVIKDDAPWFIATDVAKVLEYRTAGDMARILDPDEADTHIVRIRSGNGVEQQRKLTIINESGLHHATLISRKPVAKAFRKWVTGTVLPTIRKTGRYEAPAALPNPFAYDPKQVAGQRYLVSFSEDGCQFSAKPIPGDACVMTPAQFAKALSTPNGLYVESCTLSDLIVHAARRLECRVRG